MSTYMFNKLIEEEADIRKAKAKIILFWNSISSGLIGVIPGVDLAVQKLIIQKQTTKKIGQIFGLDINIILKEDSLKNKITDKKIDIEKDIIIKEENDSKKEIVVQSGKNIIPILSSTGNITGNYAPIPTGITTAALRGVSMTFFFVGIGVGVTTGYCFTYYQCQKIIDKLYNYFKKNMKVLLNSLELAVEHLEYRANLN